MMIPTLPQNDTQPDQRAAALAASRAEVNFDRTRGGICLPDRVPHGHGLSEEFIVEASVLGYAADLSESVGAFEVALDDTKTPEERWEGFKSGLIHTLSERLGKSVRRPFRPIPPNGREPLTVAEHALLFGELPQTEGVARWHEDFYFAWQRIASDANGLIRLITPESWKDLHKKMPLTQKTYGHVCPGDKLDAAIAEHRLFVCDHALVDGIDAGYHDGWRRWLPAAIAILGLAPDRQTLMPVAIQCGQVPGDQFPIWTPKDGVAWQMAKAAFNATDSTYHGVVSHGTECHFMGGAISVAVLRTLAPTHPVRRLLEPHFDMTIGISQATFTLFEPGGRTPRLQSISVDGIHELNERGWRSFDWHAQTLDRHFTARGLTRDVLPNAPARDDIFLYTPAIQRFVQSYVNLYYARDEDVVGDRELQAFIALVKSPTGADVPTFTGADQTVTTLFGLADLLAGIIWRFSPWHCLVNYPVYEATAFAPAYPASLFAPPPRAGRTYEHEDFLGMLPPEDVVRGLFADLVQVSTIRLNRLGHYPLGTFTDPRVHGIVDRFKVDLDGIGREIRERNKLRPIAFPYLDPKLVTASTHI